MSIAKRVSSVLRAPERAGRTRPALLALPVALALAAPGHAVPACEGEGVAAQVVSLSGSAWIEVPDEAPRALVCDDAITACDTVRTAPGSRVGILGTDLYAHLGGSTRARVASSDAGSMLFLDAGAVRTVHALGESGGSVLVHTRDGSLVATEADAEISLAVGPSGPYTRICSHGGAVETGGHPGAPVVAVSGACAEMHGGGAALLAGAAPDIEIAGPLSCGLPVADLADRFDPTDVAAPGVAGGFPAVNVGDNFRRRPCDDTGVCSGTPRVPPGGPPNGPPSPPPPPSSNPIVVAPPPGSVCGAPGFPCATN